MSASIDTPAPADRADWEQLYRGYATFYGAPMNDGILETVWSWIVAPEQPFHCILARDQAGKSVGFMHFRPMYSPLGGTMAGFLDDLYVEPAARGAGHVDRLFQALAAEARERGWPVVRWITRDNNYRARGVYDKVALRSDWITYELRPED